MHGLELFLLRHMIKDAFFAQQRAGSGPGTQVIHGTIALRLVKIANGRQLRVVFAFQELLGAVGVGGEELILDDLWGDDGDHAQLYILEIVRRVQHAFGDQQRLVFAHLDHLAGGRAVLAVRAFHNEIRFVAGMIVRGIEETARPDVHHAHGQMLAAVIDVVQIAEIQPLVRVEELANVGRVQKDGLRFPAILRERMVAEYGLCLVCHKNCLLFAQYLLWVTPSRAAVFRAL